MATSTTEIDTLRQELKVWEKNFQADHAGRKPSREEIRANPSIKAKYRQYDTLCRPAPPPQEKVASTPRKPRPENTTSLPPPPTTTPRKPSPTTLSPPKSADPEPEPTPAFIRSALGPTPQKDGHVLGIFDLLSSSGGGTTPSKPTPTRDTLTATPSKQRPSTLSRTPQSASQRFYLETFAGTPLTLKRKREFEVGDGEGDSGVRMAGDATPSFLRRRGVEFGAGEGGGLFKRPVMRKSLSSVIRGMREREEERMQAEWDVLDELEAEARGESPLPRQSAVHVEDSQGAGDMPLGPDKGLPESEDEEAAPLGRDGLPRKVWKKKGLKRQTRRVKMRPVLRKPGKAAELGDVEEESEGEGDGGVAQTQERKDDASEHSGSDYGDDDEMPASPSKVRKTPAAVKSSKEAAAAPPKPDNPLKKAGKKVAATAHANFRRLNIKNKNSKAKGRGGRFGKR